MTRKTTFTVLTAALLLAGGPALAQEQQAQRAQRGGLVGNLPGQATLPLEAAPEAPVSNQASQAPSVAPALPDELDIPQASIGATTQAPPITQAPDVSVDAPLGDVTLPAAQSQPSAQQGPAAQPAAEKRPGFFKRTWAKIKAFGSKVKDTISRALKRNKKPNAPALEDAQQAPASQQELASASAAG